MTNNANTVKTKPQTPNRAKRIVELLQLLFADEVNGDLKRRELFLKKTEGKERIAPPDFEIKSGRLVLSETCPNFQKQQLLPQLARYEIYEKKFLKTEKPSDLDILLKIALNLFNKIGDKFDFIKAGFNAGKEFMSNPKVNIEQVFSNASGQFSNLGTRTKYHFIDRSICYPSSEFIRDGSNEAIPRFEELNSLIRDMIAPSDSSKSDIPTIASQTHPTTAPAKETTKAEIETPRIFWKATDADFADLIIELWNKGYIRATSVTDALECAIPHFENINPDVRTLRQGSKNREYFGSSRRGAFSNIPEASKPRVKRPSKDQTKSK